MPDQFEVLTWLNGYYNNNTQFNTADVRTIANFSLLWNLFESKLGADNMCIDQLGVIAKETADKPGCNTFYPSYLSYLRIRYIGPENNTNSTFDNLRFRQNDKKDFVISVLRNEITEPGLVIEAILIIIYRLRNNLFHGTKELQSIHTQYDNFNNANLFLSQVLDLNK